MVDFTQYQPPGVYVQDTATPLVATTGVPPTVVCIIGTSLGYQTFTEIVTMNHTTGVPLTQRGAWMSSAAGGTAHTSNTIAAPVVKKLSDGTVLTEGAQADYIFSYAKVNAGDPVAAGVATLTGVGSALDGTQVVVTYNYTNASYYRPALFSDYDDIVNTYGQPTIVAPSNVTAAQLNAYAASASQVVTPLTLAAKIAFENGANQLILVPLDPSTGSIGAQFSDAYTKIAADNRINIVVPLFIELSETTATTTLANVEALFSGLTNALTAAGNNGIGRIACVGTSKNFDPNPTTSEDTISLANNVNSQRVILAYPQKLNYYNASLNQTTQIDGAYLAAAYAGRLSAIPVNKALTRETINSFSGLSSDTMALMTRTFKDSLSKAGVAVTEVNTSNNMWVRHGVSTAPGNLLTREPSLTRQRDALFALMQTGLENADVIGQPITADTPLSLKGVAAGILESAVSNGVILAYSNLLVRQQQLPGGDPTAIEIKFAYQPAVPLNYVTVTFSIDLSSGLVAVTDQTA